jgi:hypothetical protein
MLVTCEYCSRSLEFSGDRPSFCAYCGRPLVVTTLPRTDSYQSPVTGDSQGATQLPPNNRIITFSGVAQRLPEQIAGYKVLRQIGAGGMGTVYEAEDAINGRSVAIKLIKPQIAASTENIERFRQEGKLASLITHPRCVFVYQADEDQGRPYIVMEMMPGATLKDIVSQQGPLQLGQAIAKMLDVIDGLQAAHQLGVIHRDVKPSNCFVLTDGHVKIGDFGLSKVLPLQTESSARTPLAEKSTTAENINSDGITRTGVFIGTPLFASPEQIKGDVVDFRTDVYSVTATLYFLLTGQAPFEGGDNTATIARIVSEDPQSLLTLRPDIPVELDRIVMRGLERDAASRIPSLAELRAALVQFLPGYLQNAPRSARIRAAIIDAAVLAPGVMLVHQLVPKLMEPGAYGDDLVELAVDLSFWVLVLAYFVATEVVAGASFGKWLLHLKIGGSRPGKPPKRRQLLLRALGFFVIVVLPGILALVLTSSDWWKWAFHGIGLLILFDSMRARGGFRGLHEILSKTCVVQVPHEQQPVRFPFVPPTVPAPLPPGIPSRIGNYAVDGIHRVFEDRIFLVGTDLILGRQVWLVMRPLEEGKIPAARREISRKTRMRWLGGGDVGMHKSSKLTHHWDAYIAPATGCSLTHLVATEGKLSWTTARFLLIQLADELAISLNDDTFPDDLSLEQIWLQPDGQLVLVGARFHEGVPSEITDEAPDAIRSVQFLKEASQLMLEGKVTSAEAPRSLRSPMPWYERSALDRLMGKKQPSFTHPRQVAEALRENAHRPTEVTSMMRLGHMLLYGLLVGPIVLAILVIGRYYLDIKPNLQLTHQVRRADRVMIWMNNPENTSTFKKYLETHPHERRLIQGTALLELMATPGVSLISREQRDRFLMACCQGWIKKQSLRDSTRLNILSNQMSLAAMLPQLAAVELMTIGKGVSESVVKVAQEELQLALLHALDPRPLEQEELPLIQRLTALQLATFTIGFWFVAWVVWSIMTQGGLSMILMGIDLQRRNGQRAGPLRCGWRTFIVWAPFFALVMISVWIQDATKNWGNASGPLWVYWIPWWLALIYLAGSAMSSLIWPKRSWYDRLARVYLVPR